VIVGRAVRHSIYNVDIEQDGDALKRAPTFTGIVQRFAMIWDTMRER
jgi:hypothetical protein